MEDGRGDMNETNARGTDWEVVALTASTYAAAPGPRGFDPAEQHKKEEINKSEEECSDAMIMSKHFVVQPENLPADNFCSEIFKEQSIHDEKITESQKSNKDKCMIDSKNDLSESQLFGMGCSLSDHDMDLRDGKQEDDLIMVEKEQTLFASSNYTSFDDEADMCLPVIHDAITNLAEPINTSQEKLDYPSNEENNDENCDAWWKKRAMSVYNHAKGTNTFWSIFVAVAVAGLVILGQRWRREKSQFQQFKWKYNGPDEKINWMAGPVSRIKVLVGGNHRGSMREGLHPTF